MNSKTIIALLVAMAQVVLAADSRYTPAAGSAERQAICDGVRPYVVKKYATAPKLPQPIVFKVRRIDVLGNYCSFEAVPVFKDGSPVGTEYMEDIVFDLCLKKSGDTWQVIYDFSRTDVPDDAELKRMWQAFPKEFPFSLLPKFWRDQFSKVKS